MHYYCCESALCVDVCRGCCCACLVLWGGSPEVAGGCGVPCVLLRWNGTSERVQVLPASSPLWLLFLCCAFPPRSVAVLLQRGNAYMNLGRAVEAIADADRVLQVEKRIQDKLEGNAPVVNGVRRYKRPPPNFRALLLKAESLFLAGKFEYAMVYFHQVGVIARQQWLGHSCCHARGGHSKIECMH